MNHEHAHPAGGFRAPFAALSLLGLVGVAAIIPYTLGLRASMSDLPLPLPSLAALSLLQAAILTMLFVAVGTLAACRLGFVSRVVQATRGDASWRAGLARDLSVGLIAGVAGALLLLAGDLFSCRSSARPCESCWTRTRARSCSRFRAFCTAD